MYWHISWKVWFINLNVCCCNGCSCCWVNVNKSKKVSSLAAKIEYVIINSNWMHEIMAGQKKKFGYSSESPWFPESYFGWIIIGNRHHETSIIYCALMMKKQKQTEIRQHVFMIKKPQQRQLHIYPSSYLSIYAIVDMYIEGPRTKIDIIISA